MACGGRTRRKRGRGGAAGSPTARAGAKGVRKRGRSWQARAGGWVFPEATQRRKPNMCWSGVASLGVATIGVAGSLWARRQGAPLGRWATLLYFTGMELLQAITYAVI